MKAGEIWKAKPNHPIRWKWDMIRLIKAHKDGWSVWFFQAEETPEDERYDDSEYDEEDKAYENDYGYLSREDIVDQFYKLY